MRSPINMGELTCVEVQILHPLLFAEENHGNAQSMRKARFVIDAAPSTIVAVSEVSHDEPRLSDLRDDNVINLVEDIFFPIYALGLVPRCFNGGSNTISG